MGSDDEKLLALAWVASMAKDAFQQLAGGQEVKREMMYQYRDIIRGVLDDPAMRFRLSAARVESSK